MGKQKLVKWFIIITMLFWFLNYTYATSILPTTTKYVSWKDILLLKASTQEQIDSISILMQSKLKAECFDDKDVKTDKIKFVCEWNWETANWQLWCGVKRLSYDAMNWYCTLVRTDKTNVWLKYNLKMYKIKTEAEIADEKRIEEEKKKQIIDYKKDLDISGNFYSKRIQAKELSCESSATSDILSTLLNKNITEDDVISKLPKSWYWTAAYVENWKKYWWDPDVWFVGYIDKFPKSWVWALQWKYEWYWVNEAPIAKVYSDYWIKTDIINKYTRKNFWINSDNSQLTYILKEINKWNYVQLWGDTCTYPTEEDWTYSWKLTTEKANNGTIGKNNCVYPFSARTLTWYYKKADWTEKKITWLNGEHAFYLLWYKWTVENPTHIIVWDTNTGKHTYKTSEWLRKWWKMEFRSIIVYK